MFGLDTNEKELKELLAQLGCEASVFKNFKSKLDKVNKRYASVDNAYQSARQSGQELLQMLSRAEAYFTEHQSTDFVAMAKAMKKMKGTYIHEFLVTSHNQEFASTYETLIQKLPGLASGKENELFVQSEVENLMAMLKEDLDHPRPNLMAYSYFLCDHKDSQLADMNIGRKLDFIEELYQAEVTGPVLKAVRYEDPRFEALFAQLTK